MIVGGVVVLKKVVARDEFADVLRNAVDDHRQSQDKGIFVGMAEGTLREDVLQKFFLVYPCDGFDFGMVGGEGTEPVVDSPKEGELLHLREAAKINVDAFLL